MRHWIVIGLFFTTTAGIGQNTWIKRDSVNGPPRGACSSFELNGEAFVLTGIDVEEFKRKMYSYDLEQDDWDGELELGGESGEGLDRASAVGFSGGGYGFIALGNGASSLKKDTWRYDPETESWTQMADFEGSPRSGAIAFVVDNIAYVGTGLDAEGVTADFYKYELFTNVWTRLADFPGGARKEAVGFTMGGKGYVGTGRGNSGYFTDFWEFNPLTENWTEKAEFPGTPRLGAVGCGTFPSAFIMMGEDNDFNYRKDVWEYNYFGNVWSQRADFMGGTRTQASAIVVDDRIFVGLGYNGIYHDDFYEYQRLPASLPTEMNAKFSVYPNPVIDEFTITISVPIHQPILQLYGSNGQAFTGVIRLAFTSPTQLKIDLDQTLAKGVYYLTISDGDQFLGTQKISI